MLSRTVGRMTNRGLSAVQRTQAISRHMSSKAPVEVGDDALVQFESAGHIRRYILNREKKLNSLNEPMLNILRPYVEDFAKSDLGKVLVGTGKGRAFCAGGDVAAIMQDSLTEETRPRAIEFFRREFELDFILASLQKPYVVVMDGITMGGGVGLSANASFRIATENTKFAMPETKIGYAPDVGGSFFLSRMDGELGAYLGLTGDTLSGRAVFEHGFATHFIPSRRVSSLLERLASLENPSYFKVNNLIEEHYSEREPDEPTSSLVGEKRKAIDFAFRHNTVEEIIADLENIRKTHEVQEVREWADSTLELLNLRSPTSLKVALAAIRRGKSLSLLEALQMEMNFATAFCSGETPDFKTGVTAVLVEKIKGRPAWSPPTLAEVNDKDIISRFFQKYSPSAGTAPALSIPEEMVANNTSLHPMRWALPTEAEIRAMVDGSHPSSGSTQLTLPELLKKFETLREGKFGVKEKVLEVVSRKCEEVEHKETGLKLLQWIH